MARPAPDPALADAMLRSLGRMNARLVGIEIQDRCGFVPLSAEERESLDFGSDLWAKHRRAPPPEIGDRLVELRHLAARYDEDVARQDCALCRLAGRCVARGDRFVPETRATH